MLADSETAMAALTSGFLWIFVEPNPTTRNAVTKSNHLGTNSKSRSMPKHKFIVKLLTLTCGKVLYETADRSVVCVLIQG